MDGIEKFEAKYAAAILNSKFNEARKKYEGITQETPGYNAMFRKHSDFVAQFYSASRALLNDAGVKISENEMVQANRFYRLPLKDLKTGELTDLSFKQLGIYGFEYFKSIAPEIRGALKTFRDRIDNKAQEMEKGFEKLVDAGKLGPVQAAVLSRFCDPIHTDILERMNGCMIFPTDDGLAIGNMAGKGEEAEILKFSDTELFRDPARILSDMNKIYPDHENVIEGMDYDADHLLQDLWKMEDENASPILASLENAFNMTHMFSYEDEGRHGMAVIPGKAPADGSTIFIIKPHTTRGSGYDTDPENISVIPIDPNTSAKINDKDKEVLCSLLHEVLKDVPSEKTIPFMNMFLEGIGEKPMSVKPSLISEGIDFTNIIRRYIDANNEFGEDLNKTSNPKAKMQFDYCLKLAPEIEPYVEKAMNMKEYQGVCRGLGDYLQMKKDLGEMGMDVVLDEDRPVLSVIYEGKTIGRKTIELDCEKGQGSPRNQYFDSFMTKGQYKKDVVPLRTALLLMATEGKGRDIPGKGVRDMTSRRTGKHEGMMPSF